MMKRATKQTRNKACPQANAGARVQTHIDRRRARRPKDFVVHIEIAHHQMHLNAAGYAFELQLVRHLERMVMHLVDGDDPMDVDGDVFDRSS